MDQVRSECKIVSVDTPPAGKCKQQKGTVLLLVYRLIKMWPSRLQEILKNCKLPEELRQSVQHHTKLILNHCRISPLEEIDSSVRLLCFFLLFFERVFTSYCKKHSYMYHNIYPNLIFKNH